MRRWVPKAYATSPIYVFETGGTTGIPKTRINIEDFRIDYELFSETLPDDKFPKGGQLAHARPERAAPASPCGRTPRAAPRRHLLLRRSRSALGRQADQKGWGEHLEAYKDHVIDQAVTILGAGHDIRCMFTTPKLLEALALKLESKGTTIRQAGVTGIFSGGTEFTPQWNRFAHEELLDGVYMTPTYGNTLMGLAASAPSGPHNNYKITYYAPQPRAVVEVVDFDDPMTVVGYGQTGRVKLTTLTKEFFMPGFLERDEGEREPETIGFRGTASAACVHSGGLRRRRRWGCIERRALGTLRVFVASTDDQPRADVASSAKRVTVATYSSAWLRWGTCPAPGKVLVTARGIFCAICLSTRWKMGGLCPPRVNNARAERPATGRD